VETDCVTKTGL